LQSRHVPRKRFGQNFLQDGFIIDQIISAISPQPDQHLIEIGPGLGALTTQILPLVKQLDVVELDRDVIPRLQAKCAKFNNLTIHQADALRFDFSRLQNDKQKLRIFGNLPYNISTPLLFHLTNFHTITSNMHFMLQKEVAERICAPVGTRQYGRLSIMMQYFYQTKMLFTIYPEAFDPQPKVTSAFIRLMPHSTLPFQAKDTETLSQIVQTAFSQRRKTIKNTLKSLIESDELQSLAIDPGERPEKLSIEQYVKLANFISTKN